MPGLLGVRSARRPQARPSTGTRPQPRWPSSRAGPAAPLPTAGVPGAHRRGPEPRLTACLAPAWGSWRAGPVSVPTSQSHRSPPGQERHSSGRADTGCRSTALLESGWSPRQALHAEGRDPVTHPPRALLTLIMGRICFHGGQKRCRQRPSRVGFRKEGEAVRQLR